MKPKLAYLVGLLLIILWSIPNVYSQSVYLEKSIKPVGFDKSERLSDIKIIPPGYRDRTWKESVVQNKDGFQEEFKNPSTWTGPDPVLQNDQPGNRSTATIGQNWAGIPNLSGVAPPDTDGDVGPNHYMQMVNMSFQIWDKSGNSLYGPADNSTLWSGFTGPWSTTNDGDPIVLYDEYADRWIATQFALPNFPSGPFYELVAVSETGDPTGAWYRYAYEFSNMPDYPKFGIWPDGYYFTINQFAPPNLNFAGAGVCVLDRAAMLIGDSQAEMLFFNLGTSYGSLLPADADGSTPPSAGSPNYLANMGSNSLRIWEADIDWVNTANSSVTLVNTISVQPFSYSGITINQPGTSQTLDQLATRLMYRLQYRNFGSYEVMLTNHTVNADGNGQAGVRWYELRNNGSGWSLYQQGTFAPADGDNRWMGSVAMNGNGDIAVGYSVSSSTTYPSIRIAGQQASNSGSGVLDVTETSIIEGSNSQTGVNRWGDYSMMSVDPTDDITFWYTTEYSNGGWDWQTQVASFSYVVVPPVANFEGNPTQVMEGQTVAFTDLSSNGPTSWLWSFPGGTPSSSTDQNPVVTYPSIGTYDVSLTVTNSAGSDTHTKTSYIDVIPYSITYCTSSGSNTSVEWIETITFGSFTNTSGSDGGYGDYTSQQISVESGVSYDISLIPGFSDRSRREFWRIWIDYNIDGDFTDNGEEVLAVDGSRNNVYGSISIPSGVSGETRMRVSMQYKIAAASCDHFTYGEVEDYTIIIGTAVPQVPVADFTGTPTTVTVGNVVQFDDLSLHNPTSWSWTFAEGTPSSSTDQNPGITYNTVGGPYAVSLTVTNDQGSDTKTITEYITVTEGGTYCTSQSQSNDLDWIAQVDIGSFSNPSGASLYSDFTGLIIGLSPGSANNVTLTPYYTGRAQREFWRIWIDFNGDGDFDDSDEQVFVANNKKDVVSGTLNIPSYASGQTRMRVTMKNGGSPTSCETFSNGEVEDYTVDFGAAPTSLVKNDDVEFEMNIFPNPASTVLNVNISSNTKTVNIKIYNAMGRIIDDFNMETGSSQINLGSYPEGIYYIGADNGQQNTTKKFMKQ